jgi:hypothetical protein
MAMDGQRSLQVTQQQAWEALNCYENLQAIKTRFGRRHQDEACLSLVQWPC